VICSILAIGAVPEYLDTIAYRSEVVLEQET